jgi:hypothetical protein
MQDRLKWHHLFGICLTDYFSDLPYTVELEKDLSLKQQFLDVVIIRKTHEDYPSILPDGLENLKNHNLLSYKSLHESFDAWAIQELIGHYVNYRKQLCEEPLIDESEFSLYAISTRFPAGLNKRVTFTEIQTGVYELELSIKIRLIVLNQIVQAEHNLLWHLFSHAMDNIRYAKKHYKPKTNLSSAINVLYEYYQLEGLIMPYTLEQFQKEVALDHLHFLSANEILKQVPEIMSQAPISERLKGLSAQDILSQVSINELLKGLSKEEIFAFLEQAKN